MEAHQLHMKLGYEASASYEAGREHKLQACTLFFAVQLDGRVRTPTLQPKDAQPLPGEAQPP